MEKLRNCSFIFLPFLFETSGHFAGGPEVFDDIIGKGLSIGDAPLNHMTSWTMSDTKIRKYMLKYIQDIFLTDDTRFRKMLMLEPADIGKVLLSEGHIQPDQLLKFTPVDGRTDENCSDEYGFQIKGVNIYMFRTGVGIVCFEVEFPKSEYTYISTCEYFLQKVRQQQIPDICVDKYSGSHTLLDLARSLTDSVFTDLGFDVDRSNTENYLKILFFYYSKKDTERADFFTFLDVDGSDRKKVHSDARENNSDARENICIYEKELFYLDRCYKPSFSYVPGSSKDSVYQSSAGKFWGITQKCTACIFDSTLEGATRSFHDTFFSNFKDHYRFMYVLILHQKYALHMYLSRRVPTEEMPELDREHLERYQEQLYAFKTDFVFACISEIEQYQDLYKMINEEFALSELYTDVDEPLQKLDELEKKKKEEEEQKKEQAEHERESIMNFVLAVIALLSIFSALKDSFDYFGDLLDTTRWPFLIGFSVFAVIAAFIIYKLFNKNEKQ